ncbi:hypothetical protein [Streptomyces caatingaensis]|uniref:hypothetical protein n=1 Tax=Streptomyces caatingaensis TaxID=1678637 RepID=UPI00069E5CF2|nr:hypothetical protein [Streptomyces caatingaensis]
MSRLLHHHGGRFPDAMTRDRLFYWYVHSFLWGRHTGATETALNQDLRALDEGGVDLLIEVLRRSRGGQLEVRPDDFVGSSKGARFYPLLYMLTRVHGAQDMVSGVPLREGMLGRLNSLQVHHIFPKSRLRAQGYNPAEINAIANFCFLTQDTNLRIGSRRPADYLPETAMNVPDALASQWIPMNPKLWHTDKYLDFLAARRELLAGAANDFLERLHDGPSPVGLAPSPDSLLPHSGPVVDEPAPEDEVPGLAALLRELGQAGYASPELDSEVTDPHNGAAITVAAAYWPHGLQAESGAPVVLTLDPTPEEQAALEASDYRVFHSADALRRYIGNLRASQAPE